MINDEVVYELKQYLKQVGDVQQRVDMLVSEAEDEIHYYAKAQCMTPKGPIPVSQEINAETIEDAFDQFQPAIGLAVQRLKDQMSQPQIVIPGGTK